ncbi:c-type cytochrome [Proteobacteria bacterium 005FR1]|nr:c-type cytochrome [Proteobacteria bacterium 005FR1]
MLPIALALLSGCGERASVPELPARADVKRGRQLAEQVGCGSCHRIPGIPSANGQVGPPLEGLAERAYIAGILPNHFDTLAAWIAEPQRFAPNSAMPNLGLSEDQARDIAAYLYSQGRRNIQTGEEF